MKSNVTSLGNRIFIIDGYDLHMPERTGAYVIVDDDITIVETGPSLSVPHILQGLQELQIQLEDVRNIIVTHIHLDHAGGAGLLLQHCPQAKVYVHPKGARHLINPSRLIAGAKAVYGDTFDTLFDPIYAIPEENVISKGDGDTLQIGQYCELSFLDTPGHANHHMSIYDPISNGIFTGDTLGVRYQSLEENGVPLFLPSTSPNQFNPDAMLSSINRVKKLQVDKIYFGHYSASTNVNEVYTQLQYWLPRFVEEGEKAMRHGKDHTSLSESLVEQISDHLHKKGVSPSHPAFTMIQLDMKICAMGILDYIAERDER
ncbi:MBL fold metallo-hydrolase [Alkalihalobacillus sp. LMS39]|uniref:MBL fold metallo-hydrolase n=1 Tax=Alkalihalobacillus sp. LMS39 TaxID=2924032 RepID=UPI001FB3F534|nr:MBL fold metallo-hydrolase [Alkalihalobacillus sp. LMS39]UOE92272.1 MBL fold metallo-hydrolase [Alkalihalobacillus sp. LMS39]